jgi:hypothetical protein
LTTPEALAELRALARRFRGDPALLGQVLQAARDVLQYGDVDVITELRIRRFRRLSGVMR